MPASTQYGSESLAPIPRWFEHGPSPNHGPFAHQRQLSFAKQEQWLNQVVSGLSAGRATPNNGHMLAFILHQVFDIESPIPL